MELSRSQSIQTHVLNTASFVAQFAISMVNLALVYHLRLKFSLSAQMIGVSASIYTLSYFFFCLVLGPAAARFKPRHSVETAVAGMAFSIGAVVVSSSVWQAFTALACYGLFMSFLWPQIESWLARGKEGRDLNRATSAFNVSWSLGAAVSPLATGILVEKSTRLPLLAGIGMFLGVFLVIAVSTMVFPSMRAVVSERQSVRETVAEDRSTPLRFLSWAGVFTVYASLGVVLNIFPLHAMDHLPFTESRVGLLLLIRGAATVGMFVIMGKTSWWHFNRGLVIAVQIMSAVVCLAGTRINSFCSHAVFFFCFGVLFAMMYSFSIFHGASGSVDRSRRMLIHEMLLTAGTILGSIAGGTIYQHMDFDRVLAACSLLITVPVAVSVVVGLFVAVKSRSHRHCTKR